MEEKECKYCNPDASYGNNSIYKDEELDVYIVKDWLHLHKRGMTLASKVRINFCPVCGANIKENHCEKCFNYNIGEGIEDIRECSGCEWE